MLFKIQLLNTNRHAELVSASHPTSQLRTSQLPPPKTLPTKNCPLSFWACRRIISQLLQYTLYDLHFTISPLTSKNSPLTSCHSDEGGIFQFQLRIQLQLPQKTPILSKEGCPIGRGGCQKVYTLTSIFYALNCHPKPVEGQNRILEYLHKCTHALQMSKAHLVSVTKTSPYGCASTLVFYINFQILNVTLSLSKGKPHRHAELDSASHPRTPNSELPTSHHLKPKT